jgi:hypothetical protein
MNDVKHTRKNCGGEVRQSTDTDVEGKKWVSFWCTECDYHEKIEIIEELKIKRRGKSR